jgi:xylan 1,4-beta-xylosidase
MKIFFVQLCICLLLLSFGYGQSPSFKSYINPVIPGDHADCTVTKIGNDFYTTGSSFNVTPVIYHSTDLVHWEAIAQPVSASWSGYGDAPGGGCWGGHIVLYNGGYWHFFSRANTMHFVKAPDPKGPWSLPIKVNNPSTLPYGLGYDNSIFIDDDNKWYLVVKNGQPNNGIVELGNDGQPTGLVYNLNWINPAPSYPYSWAEGPVMWKYDGYYYYSFARDLGGGQKVMRSKALTADESSWAMLGDFFNENDPQKGSSLFTSPNHASPVIMLDDSTCWVIHPLYAKGEWKGQGRQGLLNEVRYDANGKPVADYPINQSFTAPNLSSSGIPWMVPKSDFFTLENLHPEWSFLGYTASNKWSLSDRPGWLRLSPKSSVKANTVIKNDGEHNYSLITRLDFNAKSTRDEAGLWIMRGDETMSVKLVSSLSADGRNVILFSFDNTKYEVENSAGDTLWLKLVRINHKISGYFSSNGANWTEVGQAMDISQIDSYSDFSTFTGTRQGLYVKGTSDAWFDLYIYRDAYTSILAECPANQFGTSRSYNSSTQGYVLDNIHINDWALYAGIEFGDNAEYNMQPDSVKMIASCNSTGGIVELWLDSLDTGEKIAECPISNTGSLRTFQTFVSAVKSVSGRHDVYLKFTGTDAGKLFQLQWLYFTAKNDTSTSVPEQLDSPIPQKYGLGQNFPNPFNPSTKIEFEVPDNSFISLKVYNLLGEEVAELAGKEFSAGVHFVVFDASHLANGIYFYTLRAKETDFVGTKKMVVIK